MNVRQRMADVKQLRNDVCHDFFNLIIQPGWQTALYQVALCQVTKNGRFKDAYSDVYSKMRQLDINNLANEYKVEDMDVSLMRTITSYWNSKKNNGVNYTPMEQGTLDALKSIKEDRNDDGHSSGNEDEEELYLQGLLSLVNLRQFIKAVDKNETRIMDPERLAYYQKYISEINALKDMLDDDRIELIQKTKEFDRDIQYIKNNKDPLHAWVDIYKNYSHQASTHRDDEKEEQRLWEFCIRASDAGITEAHEYAALHFMYKNPNPTEAVKRMQMIIDAYPEKLPRGECRLIVSNINEILRMGNDLTEKMSHLIEGIKKQGYVVEWREGRLVLPEEEKRDEEKRRRVAKEAEQLEWVRKKK